ncbi:hypothetical protein K7X08_023309 [Anisodus acutangulus]|uniref:Pentatricopeptide repeat-containing protein n=1 Tax=Anisodus acutangulus TaxID=402998 RepID=A0A9Q1R0H1_9SOLA|nr:hypothetical protein K7X08_023309 [Anisodus acutangulus]
MVIGTKAIRLSTNFIAYRSYCSTSDIYTRLLESYTQNGVLQSGKALHAHLIINGLAKRTHFASKLIALYAECKQLSHARKLFDKIPNSDIRRWIVLIGAYARRGFYEEAMSVFSEMQRKGKKPNKFVLPSVLKACGRFNDFRTGEILHCVILKNEFEFDSYVVSALIDMYSKCGKVEMAKRVFYGTVDKDLVALNALVSGCVQQGIVKEAVDLVVEMKVHGMKPNVVTYNTLIAGFSQDNDRATVCDVIELMHDDGLELDVVSWTSIVSGLVQNCCNEEAFDTFKRMLDVGICPSAATISTTQQRGKQFLIEQGLNSRWSQPSVRRIQELSRVIIILNTSSVSKYATSAGDETCLLKKIQDTDGNGLQKSHALSDQ